MQLHNDTKQAISRFFDGESDDIKQASEVIDKAVMDILKQSKEKGNAEFKEVSNKLWVDFDTQMDWITSDLKSKGFEVECKTEYASVGKPFAGDKVNTNIQQIAKITLKKKE